MDDLYKSCFPWCSTWFLPLFKQVYMCIFSMLPQMSSTWISQRLAKSQFVLIFRCHLIFLILWTLEPRVKRIVRTGCSKNKSDPLDLTWVGDSVQRKLSCSFSIVCSLCERDLVFFYLVSRALENSCWICLVMSGVFLTLFIFGGGGWYD